MSLPNPFIYSKNSFKKWSKMLEDIIRKTGKNYLKTCELMKSGGFINMRK